MHVILLTLLVGAVDTDTFTGKVIAVKDGDSIVVLRDKKQITIRLQDIDCPELAQAQTSDLCFGKTVIRSGNADQPLDVLGEKKV
jgi:endonuclease YncB( thermonuclease family)